jgi:hypothetical protein
MKEKKEKKKKGKKMRKKQIISVLEKGGKNGVWYESGKNRT